MTQHIILAQSRPTASALEAFLCLAKGQYRSADEPAAIRKTERINWEDPSIDLEAFRVLASTIEAKVPGSDEAMRAALETLARLTKGKNRSADEPAAIRVPERIIWEDPNVDLEAYRVLASEIEAKVSDSDGLIPPGEIVVLVDHVNLLRLNPIAPDCWDSVIAMLILTFPEIFWVFGLVLGVDDAEAQAVAKAHGLTSLFATVADPLFDGTGLREWVRSRARGMGTAAGEAWYLPKRTAMAVAIDDERSYAYIHSYAAYRFGFRAYPITGEVLMDQLLGEKGRLRGCDQLCLSIEDMFLSFPDRTTKFRDTHWSDLPQRSEKLPALDQPSVLRTFVTSGQKNGMDHDKSGRNRAFRRSLRQEDRLGTTVYKPMAGIFDLWRAAGLRQRLRDGRQRGHAPDFVWPPRYSSSPETDSGRDHSAPGRILEIASRLETRAEKLLQKVNCAVQAVQGAVLATETMELLGEKAQTTFLEALSLKHQFEAISECQFYGVQSHFDVESRMVDIQHEVHELGHYFNQSKRKEAEWNAEAAILDCLIRTYRDYNQFDEELAIGRRSRVIHRRLWFKRRMGVAGDGLRWMNPLYWAACYIHGLLTSIPLFLMVITLWVAGLSILFVLTNRQDESVTMRHGLEDAVTSFFSVGPPTHHDDESSTGSVLRNTQTVTRDEQLARLEENVAVIYQKLNGPKYSSGYVGIICLAIVAGFVHVGVFISHMYSIASRK